MEESIDPDEAFIAAALTTASNSVFNNQKEIVARALNLDFDSRNLISEINYYFAKNEFNINNPRILDAILNYQDESKFDDQELTKVIAKTYEFVSY